MVAELRIYLLGMFRVTVDGRPVSPEAWRSRRASALVKLLALAPNHRLPREQIAETLWPGFDVDAQLNNLNVAATRARAALAAAGAPPGSFLKGEADALTLGPKASVWVDVAAFEDAVAGAWRTLDPARCRQALGFYGGDLLPDDPYEEWADARRTALRTSYLALLARLGQLHVERGELDDAVEISQRLVAAEPGEETAHLALMRLYEQLGQRRQALDQFEQLETSLRRLLDAPPSREAIAFAHALRAAGPDPIVARPAAPPRPPSPAPSPLPLPLDELIGRERELAEIGLKLPRARLVTLTGPGGIGKTRLALAAAHAQAGAFADGALFVDLSPVTDPGLVVDAVARAAGVQGQGGQATIANLVAHFVPKRQLILLDNFEQVIDAAAVIAALLERAPGLSVLITSRVPLRVRGELEYPVSPLPLPDTTGTLDETELLDSPATALFIRRAEAAKPGFSVDPHNSAAIAEICRRLEGLPLAIELAAARAKVLSPAAMLARLDDPLALLVGGARDLPARQQTIRSAIAWSYDLLSPPEQRLLRRLAVFVGGWTLDAAEPVAGGDGDLGISVLDGITSLVDKNLVVQRDDPEGEPRFTMLETIREFALEQVTGSPDEAAVRNRHAGFAVAFAEQSIPHLEGSDLQRWMARLDRENANLRAALRWLIEQHDAERALRLVVALRLYWFIRGRFREGCDDILAVTSMPEARSFPGLRLDALNGASFLARETTDFERARAIAEEARAEAERIGDDKRKADALANLGYVTMQRGEQAEAKALFAECLAINRALGNNQGIADAVSFLGLIAYYDGDLETAWAQNEESLAIWEALGDRQAVVWARTRRGLLLIKLGRHAEASAELAGNLRLSQDIDFRWGICWSFYGLAILAALKDAGALAAELIEAADHVRDAAGLMLPPTEQAEVDELRARLGMADASHTTGKAGELTAERLRRLVASTSQVLSRTEASAPD